MDAPGNKFPNSLIWITGIAIILFCATGIAAIMGWIPTSMGRSGDDAALISADRFPAKPSPSANAVPRRESDSLPATVTPTPATQSSKQ